MGQERVDMYFECWKWDGELTNMEPGKCDDLAWHPVDNLPEDTLPLVKHVINDVVNGINYSEYVSEPA
jgi:hypothetical protein